MSVFIISNRKVVKDKTTGNEVFSNDGNQQALPNFRIAECYPISGNKKVTYSIIKDVENPDYENIFKVIDGQKEESSLCGTEMMFYRLYMSMKGNPTKSADIIFFIHGFGNSHEDELEHIKKLKRIYIDGSKNVQHIIYLSWPTSNNRVLTYWSDKEDSITTGQTLARIYIKLNKFFDTMFRRYKMENCKQKIHLMAHSMGCQVLKQMLGNLNEKYIIPFIGEIFLLHSDVSADSFQDGSTFSKLKNLGQRTHMYIHKSDDALTISTTTKNFSKRLGKVGPSNISSLNEETFIVDVTGVKYDLMQNLSFIRKVENRIIDHWAYLTSSITIADILSVLEGQDERRIKNRLRHDLYPNYFYLNITKLVGTT